VLVKDPISRKHISKSQLRLLLIIFKFRFVSSEYISKWLSKDKSTVYERLFVLEKQGYVHKDYDSTFHLRQRPAIYSLAPKGIKYIRNNGPNLSEVALRNMYKNRSASLQLVDHSLNIFKLCLLLRDQYPDTFDIFTKSELSAFDEFIKPRPDLYLRRASKRSTKPSYQLETIEAVMMTWILKKRLQAHQGFLEESDSWDDDYPALLLICGNNNTEKRIQRIVGNGGFDFAIYTTTWERIDSNNTKIWLKEYDSDWDDVVKFVGL
jgi:DNA-binding MarR family transcriptional regulator